VNDQDRWKKISEIIDAALARPAHDHQAFLATVCEGDDDLRLEVESLLSYHADARGLMASPALDLMAGAIAADSEALIGGQFGPYRIEAHIGSGGMGEVYRATDTRLRRTVALKILPPHLAHDPYLRTRFDEEAQAVAAVRHPHICVLYDIGQEGETGFLVMEHLAGETLAARLARDLLSPAEIFRYALEAADALAAIHESGITHGDLKPSNIMLTAAGVKLLDFGLATLHPAMSATRAGAAAPVAGTLPYMAPEQVQRLATDHRADVFAFGALLYEMVTGEQAFDGRDRAKLVAAILTDTPAPIPAIAPASVRPLEPLIRRCLAKDPAERWQNARELREELQRLAAAVSGTTTVAPPRSRHVVHAALAVAALVVLAVGAAGRVEFARALGLRPDRPQPMVAGAVPLHLGNMRLLTAEGRLEIDPAISPDGRFVAYTAGDVYEMRIFVRPIGGGEAIRLAPAAAARQYQPRWSPDGQRLLFVTPEGAFVASPTGGVLQRLDLPPDLMANDGAGMPGAPLVRVFGAAWSPDGQEVLIAHSGALTIVPLAGGAHRRLAARSWDELHHCDWSPDRRWIACVSGNWFLAGPRGMFGNVAPSSIVLIGADGGSTKEITNDSAQNLSPLWSPDSSRLYFLSDRQGIGDIYAVDVETDGQVHSAPVRVTTGLGAQAISFSADRKRLLYSAYSARSNLWSMPIPSRGPVNVSDASPLTSGNQIIEAMKVSPDGKWLLYDSTLYGSADIFRMPAGGGAVERLTSHPSHEFAPNVSWDGRWLAYHSFRTGTRDVFVQPLAGGPEEQVTNTPGQESFPTWLRDSQGLLFFDQAVKDGQFRGQFATRRSGPGSWDSPIELDFIGLSRYSVLPDQRLAYPRAGGVELSTLDRSSIRFIYRPTPNSDDPVVESVQTEPGADGRTLYLKSHDSDGRAAFWSLPLSGGAPTLLVRFDDLSRPSSRMDFSVGNGRFFFTIDDRRSNIWLADVTER